MFAICLLTFQPSTIWLKFLASLTSNKKYKIFVIVDDNEFNIQSLETEWSDFTFLKIKESACTEAGMGIMNPVIPRDHERPSAWNKACYYFSYININFENIWFIEDDVFIPNYHIIFDIDTKYINYDLLVPSNNINNTGSLEGWVWWKTIPDYIQIPWAHSMVCACRINQKILLILKDFAIKHKNKNGLLFIEFIFNTLALHHSLKVNAIAELSCIKAVKSWGISEIQNNYLYHPVKSIEHHEKWRRIISSHPYMAL